MIFQKKSSLKDRPWWVVAAGSSYFFTKIWLQPGEDKFYFQNLTSAGWSQILTSAGWCQFFCQKLTSAGWFQKFPPSHFSCFILIFLRLDFSRLMSTFSRHQPTHCPKLPADVGKSHKKAVMLKIPYVLWRCPNLSLIYTGGHRFRRLHEHLPSLLTEIWYGHPGKIFLENHPAKFYLRGPWGKLLTGAAQEWTNRTRISHEQTRYRS